MRGLSLGMVGCSLAAGVLGPAGCPAAASTLAQPQTRTAKATAAQMLALAEQLQKSGHEPQAERILALLAHDPNSDIRNEARFRQSAVLMRKGQAREAAVLLRQIVDERPDAVPARLQLATLLQEMGDQGAALRELRALRSADLPIQVARFVDRLSASLQSSKPLGFQVEFALAPDSNINRATRSDSLGTVFGDFTIEEKARSGVGATVRGMANARLAVTGKLQLTARASSEANLYRDKDFNDITLDFAAGPELGIARARLGVEAGVSQQWYGMKPYQRTLRLAGNITQPIDAVSQLRIDAGARWADNRFNDLQDGRGLSARARYERALSPQMLVVASLGADRFKATDDAYSTRSWAAGLTAYRDFGRMTFSVGAEVGRLKADERLVLLPEAREDRHTRFSFGAVFRQLTVGGFAPMTRIVVERNRSSVEFYDFKRTRTEFGISRGF
jgi:hypothetical protein